MNLLANGLPVLTFKLLTPWSGGWMLTATLESDAALPGGVPCTIVGEAGALVGTVDPDADRTYKFAESVHLGVLAGGGGWHKMVRPQHYHSDASLPLATVVSTTAAEVKERAVVTAPMSLGNDFFRVAGPASQVLRGRSWWVGYDGVTMVGPRVPRPAPLSLEILSWNEDDGTAEATCDQFIEPAMIIVDDRFGSRIVRDVELTMTGDKFRATLWLVETAPKGEGELELMKALGDVARKAIGAEWLRTYEYVVVAMAGDRVTVAPFDPLVAPAAGPLSVWCGVPGATAQLLPGTKVIVSFRNGDPMSPQVTGFESHDGVGWLPLELEFDAVKQITLGKTSALGVAVGDGTNPVAMAPVLATWAAAVVSVCALHVPPITIPPLPASFAAMKLRTS